MLLNNLKKSNGINHKNFKQPFPTYADKLNSGDNRLMNKYMKLLVIIGLASFLIQCGGGDSVESGSAAIAGFGGDSAVGANSDVSSTSNPFAGLTSGDNFGWGYFLNGPFKSTRLTSLPLKIYPAFFSESELELIRQGVLIANQAIGFHVFEVSDTFYNDSIPVVRVDEVDYNGVPAGVSANFEGVIAYTQTRSVFTDEIMEDGRVVVDCSMEFKSGFVTKYVVAHELGHCFGIIDHSNDGDSLMAATIRQHPDLDEYDRLMSKQMDILMDYFRDTGASF